MSYYTKISRVVLPAAIIAMLGVVNQTHAQVLGGGIGGGVGGALSGGARGVNGSMQGGFAGSGSIGANSFGATRTLRDRTRSDANQLGGAARGKVDTADSTAVHTKSRAEKRGAAALNSTNAAAT